MLQIFRKLSPFFQWSKVPCHIFLPVVPAARVIGKGGASIKVGIWHWINGGCVGVGSKDSKILEQWIQNEPGEFLEKVQ